MAGTLGVSWEWLWIKPDWEVGLGWQALGVLAGFLDWSLPALGAVLSSGRSPSGEPGSRGHCDLSQLSGEVQ